MVFDFVIKLYSKKETSATLKCTKVINVETAQVKISTYQAWDVWKLLMLDINNSVIFWKEDISTEISKINMMKRMSGKA